MARNPKKKINGIVNLHDIRFCASLGIDFISLNISVPTSYNISSEILPEVAGWITGSSLLAYLPTHLELWDDFKEIPNLFPETLLFNRNFVREHFPSRTFFFRTEQISSQDLQNFFREFPQAFLEVSPKGKAEIQQILTAIPDYKDRIFFNLENFKEIPEDISYNISYGNRFVEEGILNYDELEKYA